MGQRIAMPRDEALAEIYDCAKREEIASFKGHTGIVFGIVFSPGDKTIASGGDNNNACIWDAIMGKDLAVLKGHADSVRCVAFDATGEFLMAGSAHKTVKIRRGSENGAYGREGPVHGTGRGASVGMIRSVQRSFAELSFVGIRAG